MQTGLRELAIFSFKQPDRNLIGSEHGISLPYRHRGSLTRLRMKHKRQHWIPRSYLEAWCDPDLPSGQVPFVWVMPKDGGSGRRRAPKNIFHETDLYTIRLPDGSRDLTIEHGLAGLETAFAELRRGKLMAREALDLVDRATICAFTAAIQARTPRQRDHLGQFWAGILEDMEAMREAMRKAKPEDRERLAKGLGGIPSSGPSLGYDDVRRLAEAPLQHTIVPVVQTQVPLLLGMDLAILATDEVPGFITSDAPCVWFDPEARSRPFPYNAPGLAWPTIEVTLPISPAQLLLLNRAGLNGYYRVPDTILDELNRRTRAHSDEHFIVSRDVTKPIWFDMGAPPTA